MRHRLEGDDREPLRPGREREDVEVADQPRGVVAVAREDDPVADAQPLRRLLEPRLERAALLEVTTEEDEPRVGNLGQRLDQLALALDVAEAGHLADERRAVRDPELGAECPRRCRIPQLDSVVDDLDPVGIALREVGAARVLGDRDQRRAATRRPVVEAAEQGRGCRPKVVLDVQVAHDRNRGSERGHRIRRCQRVRVQEIGAAK